MGYGEGRGGNSSKARQRGRLFFFVAMAPGHRWGKSWPGLLRGNHSLFNIILAIAFWGGRVCACPPRHQSAALPAVRRCFPTELIILAVGCCAKWTPRRRYGWQAEPLCLSPSLSRSLCLSSLPLSHSHTRCLSLCLTLCLCLFICLHTTLSLCLTLYVSLCPCLTLSLYLTLFMSLSVSLSVSLSMSVSVSLYIAVSLSFWVNTTREVRRSRLYRTQDTVLNCNEIDQLMFMFGYVFPYRPPGIH